MTWAWDTFSWFAGALIQRFTESGGQDTNTFHLTAADGVLVSGPSLMAKPRAAVDIKTETAKQRINEATQGIKKELNPDSHQLAHDNPAIQGAVVKNRAATGTNGGIADIGWHRDTAAIPDPLIHGIRNGILFSYIRRFNKVRYHSRPV